MKKARVKPPVPAPKPRAPARIVIVDDHPMVRERLTYIVQEEGGMVVCGEAESEREAMGVIDKTRPDLAIIDLSLKDSHGLELIKSLAQLHPELKILVVSLHEAEVYAPRALRAGAHGYITKQEATRDILHAIRKVLAGQGYFAPADAFVLAGTAGLPPNVAAAIGTLSDRELQVFEKILECGQAPHLARRLGMSVASVETYIKRIRRKLGARDSREILALSAAWRARRDQAPK